MESLQRILVKEILRIYPNAIIKKVDIDNFLDIHLPDVNEKKGTHLFFNTSGEKIKLGFYCREKDFVENAINSSDQIEKYSQGLRLLGNPQFLSVDEVLIKVKYFLDTISNKTDSNYVSELVEAQTTNHIYISEPSKQNITGHVKLDSVTESKEIENKPATRKVLLAPENDNNKEKRDILRKLGFGDLDSTPEEAEINSQLDELLEKDKINTSEKTAPIRADDILGKQFMTKPFKNQSHIGTVPLNDQFKIKDSPKSTPQITTEKSNPKELLSSILPNDTSSKVAVSQIKKRNKSKKVVAPSNDLLKIKKSATSSSKRLSKEHKLEKQVSVKPSKIDVSSRKKTNQSVKKTKATNLKEKNQNNWFNNLLSIINKYIFGK